MSGLLEETCIRLTLPMPPTTNHLYRSGTGANGKPRRFKTKEAQVFEKAVGDAALLAGVSHRSVAKLSPPYRLEMWVYFGTKRRADVDNRIKATQDPLASHFGFDDSLITELYLHKRYDASRPRCEVLLTTAEDAA